jgi:hypothetical protein
MQALSIPNSQTTTSTTPIHTLILVIDSVAVIDKTPDEAFLKRWAFSKLHLTNIDPQRILYRPVSLQLMGALFAHTFHHLLAL